MVLLFALTVMRTCPAVTYQFLPLRSNVAKSSRIKHRQKFEAVGGFESRDVVSRNDESGVLASQAANR